MLGPSLSVKGGISSLERMIDEQNFEDVNLEILPTMHDRSLIGRFSHWLIRLITWPLRSIFHRPDIVHIHFSHGASTVRKTALLWLWKISGSKVILHSHSSSFQSFFPKLPSPLRWFISFSFRKADMLIVLSESWKSYYSLTMRIPESRINILSTPVMLPSRESNIKVKNTVFFSGRIGVRKGTFDLIEAWNLLPEEITNEYNLIISGDGEINKARRLAASCKNPHSIEVVGWVSEDRFSSILQSCKIYVLPSRNEGLPMGLIEAMSHSKAVITTPVGGIPELINHGQNGILVEPGNIEQIKNSLQNLISNPSEVERLSINSRKSVEPLSMDIYKENLLSLWKEVLGC